MKNYLYTNKGDVYENRSFFQEILTCFLKSSFSRKLIWKQNHFACCTENKPLWLLKRRYYLCLTEWDFLFCLRQTVHKWVVHIWKESNIAITVLFRESKYHLSLFCGFKVVGEYFQSTMSICLVNLENSDRNNEKKKS